MLIAISFLFFSCAPIEEGNNRTRYTEAEMRGLIAAKQAKILPDSISVRDTLTEKYYSYILIDSMVFMPFFSEKNGTIMYRRINNHDFDLSE